MEDLRGPNQEIMAYGVDSEMLNNLPSEFERESVAHSDSVWGQIELRRILKLKSATCFNVSATAECID